MTKVPIFIFHIGMPKAASTTFQRHLRAKSDALARARVAVVDGSVGPMALDLEDALSRSRDWSTTQAARACEDAVSDGHSVVIVTSEGLSNAEDGFVAGLGDWLKNQSPSAFVILGIRNTLDWAVSSWQQGVRRGDCSPLMDSLSHFLSQQDPANPVSRPDTVAAKWMSYLPGTRLRGCRVRNVVDDPGGPLVGTLLKALPEDVAATLKQTDFFLADPSAGSVFAANSSGSLVLSEMLRRLNETLPTSIDFLRSEGLWEFEASRLVPHLAEQLERRMVEVEGELGDAVNGFVEAASWQVWGEVDSQIELGIRSLEAQG